MPGESVQHSVQTLVRATDKRLAKTGVAKVLEEFQGCFQVLLDLKDDPWQTPPDASQHF